jgi:hypothetical protein
MPLFLRPATEDDSPGIGRIGQAAFQDSLSTILFPAHLHANSETGDPRLDEAQWRAARTTRRMREGKPTFVVVEGSEAGDGDAQVVGFAQWELPSQKTSSEMGTAENERQEPFPPALDQDALRDLYKKIEEMTMAGLGPSKQSNMWCKPTSFGRTRVPRFEPKLTSPPGARSDDSCYRPRASAPWNRQNAPEART